MWFGRDNAPLPLTLQRQSLEPLEHRMVGFLRSVKVSDVVFIDKNFLFQCRGRALDKPFANNACKS
jgi:hypothetical protein